MTVHTNLPEKILNAQTEAMKEKMANLVTVIWGIMGLIMQWNRTNIKSVISPGSRLRNVSRLIEALLVLFQNMEKLRSPPIRGKWRKHHGFVSGLQERQVVLTQSSVDWQFAGVMLEIAQLTGPEWFREDNKIDYSNHESVDNARSIRKKYKRDVKTQTMEFQVGDMVMLKVSPLLELPDKLSGIHSTLHVSNLKKCLADENLVIPLEEI
ncbi:hypothetical protein Tco_1482190 [Tanacetum coccineum]